MKILRPHCIKKNLTGFDFKNDTKIKLPNVLLVDDDQLKIDLAQLALKDICKIEPAINGLEALARQMEKYLMQF